MNTIALDFKHIRSYTHEETIRLISAAQSGCLESQNQVVEANLKLVLKIMHRFKSHAKESEDLFQHGVIGLIKSVSNFDTNTEFQFSTYAFPVVLGEMRRYIRDHGCTVRVSRSIKENSRKVLNFKEQFVQEHHKDPCVREMAEGLSMEEGDVLLALDAETDVLSIFHTYQSGDKEGAIADRLSDGKDWAEDWIQKESIKKSFEGLNETERWVMSERYFGCKKQQEIANTLSISQAQVSRIEKHSLRKMKSLLL